MKTILEMVEKVINVSLLSSSCMGFTLFGWFILKLFLPEVTEDHLWTSFIISLVLTFVLNRLQSVVDRILIKFDLEELALLQDEKALALYEHLKEIK